MSIENKILRHLKSGRPLTANEAAIEYGTLRLSAYIYNLRQKGYQITTRQKQTFKGKSIAQYQLVEQDDKDE